MKISTFIHVFVGLLICTTTLTVPAESITTESTNLGESAIIYRKPEPVQTFSYGLSIPEISGNTALFYNHVYVRGDDGQWTEQAVLDIGTDHKIRSVAIDGDTALLGIVGDDEFGDAAESVYVYVRDDAGQWSLQTKLAAADSHAQAHFGSSMALQGDVALIAAPGTNYATLDGAVYVFVRGNDGQWSQQAKLTAANGDNPDYFGNAVALDGDTALIGARYDINEQGKQTGAGHVFVRDADGHWHRQVKLVLAEPKPWGEFGAEFGASVALDGDTALIRAQRTVYVYQRDEQGQWSQHTKLAAHGWSIALQGHIALVGDIIGEQSDGEHDGTVTVAVRNSDGVWTEPVKLEDDSSLFGGEVRLDGNTVMVKPFSYLPVEVFNLSDIITP